MINRLAEDGDVTKSLVMNVAADGTVSSDGNYDKFSHNPTIQVIFEDNKSSAANQTQWIQNVMKELKIIIISKKYTQLVIPWVALV